MKKTLLLMLVTCWSLIMMAGNVTPEEALQQATKFMKERVAKGARRAPVAASSLTMAKDVCGLYVFNVGNDAGFVIVSPDDRTVPVLGYGDSGSIDPDNMPENMRSWLQGYADEIKWLNEHNIQPIANVRRVSPVKPAIDPMMQTHWNQDEPFNDQCPEYTSGKKSATGCVATAMAQAMYYNQWPTAATAEIPEYTWKRKGTTLVALSATTFDWGNMIKDYTYSYNSETGKYDKPDFTSAQATAVATLMRYCGQSLQMNYGSSSSASTGSVPDALKTYFDYASTTQYVERNDYTYGNWIEMIYNELTQGRVVIYRGDSSGGGHAFICDGYQGEDYFHINWGWGGMSDNYFKLSACDPDAQGIGGSSSKDGYHIGQGAVVGIQKSTETGTVLENKTNYNLSATVTVSASPTQYKEVEVTLNVSNAGTDTYDGEIGAQFIRKDGEDWVYEDQAEKVCVVPTGGSPVVCKLSFVPKYSGEYAVMPLRGSSSIGSWKDFTVVSGSPDPEVTATDNVDLTMTFDVETAEDRGITISYGGGSQTSPSYNLYGNDFNLTFTLANSTANNYSGKIYWCLLVSGELGTVHSLSVEVPAGTTKNFAVTVNDLDFSKQYIFEASYVKNKSYSLAPLGYYILNPAIMTYTADGTKTVVKPSGTSYAAPAGALAVDLTGTTVTTVSGGATNCLFISDKNSLTGATNFIKNTSGTYTAANITLTDGKDFYSPVDFTATNIEFTYANDRWADGSKGWNTIMLPFDVAKVTASDTEIKWFTSSSDTGKDFWLKKFISDDPGVVNFDYVSGDMKANTPYIIALPGDHWGAANDLSSKKTIKFIGTNAEVKKSAPAVVTASNYRFVGDTKAVSTANIYCINAAGNKFEKTTGCGAFRAFFKTDIFDNSDASLRIGDENGATAIHNIKVGSDSNAYFDLNGRRVLNPTKGVYIMNGKKLIVK